MCCIPELSSFICSDLVAVSALKMVCWKWLSIIGHEGGVTLAKMASSDSLNTFEPFHNHIVHIRQKNR